MKVTTTNESIIETMYTTTESGVMVMKGDQAWGILYEDGRETISGWLDPVDARLYEARHVRLPTSVTYDDSPDFDELSTAKVVHVKRTTVLELI